jgi:hypothetical protein
MPTQKQIRAVAIQLTQTINSAVAKRLALQEACPHPDATKEPKANTGNYDPSSDCYWYDCHCPDCGKFWTEDQ